jgi:hypothetical protein
MSAPKAIIPLKPINFSETARAVEKFSQTHNIPTLTFPAETPPDPQSAAPQQPGLTSDSALAVEKPQGMKRLPMEVPEYVIDSLKRRALETKGASVRFVVLSALKAYGIDVRDEELVKDKRRQAT